MTKLSEQAVLKIEEVLNSSHDVESNYDLHFINIVDLDDLSQTMYWEGKPCVSWLSSDRARCLYGTRGVVVDRSFDDFPTGVDIQYMDWLTRRSPWKDAFLLQDRLSAEDMLEKGVVGDLQVGVNYLAQALVCSRYSAEWSYSVKWWNILREELVSDKYDYETLAFLMIHVLRRERGSWIFSPSDSGHRAIYLPSDSMYTPSISTTKEGILNLLTTRKIRRKSQPYKKELYFHWQRQWDEESEDFAASYKPSLDIKHDWKMNFWGERVKVPKERKSNNPGLQMTIEFFNENGMELEGLNK